MLTTVLCPNILLTYSMSFVLWYSVVAFQCLKVWNVILVSLSLHNFIDAFFLAWQYSVLRLSVSGVNIVPCGFLGIWFIMLTSLSLIFIILGLLPLAGVMFIVLWLVSRSCHFSIVASLILMPVSFSVCRSVAVFFPHAPISWSISCSVGINGSLLSGVYFGCFHFLFNVRKNVVYRNTNFIFVMFLTFRLAMADLTFSGSVMSHIFDSIFRFRMYASIV